MGEEALRIDEEAHGLGGDQQPPARKRHFQLLSNVEGVGLHGNRLHEREARRSGAYRGDSARGRYSGREMRGR